MQENVGVVVHIADHGGEFPSLFGALSKQFEPQRQTCWFQRANGEHSKRGQENWVAPCPLGRSQWASRGREDRKECEQAAPYLNCKKPVNSFLAAFNWCCFLFREPIVIQDKNQERRTYANILPGLRMLFGSSVRLINFMVLIVAGSSAICRYGAFT